MFDLVEINAPSGPIRSNDTGKKLASCRQQSKEIWISDPENIPLFSRNCIFWVGMTDRFRLG